MKRLAVLLLCLLPGATASAAPAPKTGARDTKGSTFLFSRDRVFIEVEAPLTANSAANATDASSGPEQPRTETRRYYYDTEIRPEESLAVDWFYSLDEIGEGHATMIVLKAARPLDLPEAKILHAIDVLVIGSDGRILAILPKIVPAAQEKQIHLDMAVKALMYLPGGDAEKLNIQPKDAVKNKWFAPNPVVLQ